MKTQFIVHCWLDVEKFLGVSQKDFAIKLRSGGWVKQRIRIFKNYTLRSLLNQSFNDFRIFLFCGQRFQHITKDFDFETDRVEKIYDYGQRVYQEMETDRVSIMRIDSDDLFHQNMMEEVRKLVLKGKKMFSTRNVIQWDINWNFITDVRIPVSPFTNHVFSKSVYKDIDLLRKYQFYGYRSSPEMLPKRRVCIIRHRQNVSWRRKALSPKSRQYCKREIRVRKNVILNLSEIIRTLKPFGIPADYVSKKGKCNF